MSQSGWFLVKLRVRRYQKTSVPKRQRILSFFELLATVNKLIILEESIKEDRKKLRQVFFVFLIRKMLLKLLSPQPPSAY